MKGSIETHLHSATACRLEANAFTEVSSPTVPTNFPTGFLAEFDEPDSFREAFLSSFFRPRLVFPYYHPLPFG